MSAQYTTSFSSIDSYEKGGVQIIDDDLKNFVFSNIYEVAATHKPYERIVVGKNLDYTLEAVRAEGTSPWYACAHDEFVIAMDHNVEVHFMELGDTSKIDDEQDGSFKLTAQPLGKTTGVGGPTPRCCPTSRRGLRGAAAAMARAPCATRPSRRKALRS